MAATRIRGTWHLSLTAYTDDVKSIPLRVGEATLTVRKATRAGISGELHIGGKVLPVVGKIKPGNPSVVSLNEADENGDLSQGGLDAMLYIPPWWPTIKYDYDVITGSMVIGEASAVKSADLTNKIILVSGVQPFA